MYKDKFRSAEISNKHLQQQQSAGQIQKDSEGDDELDQPVFIEFKLLKQDHIKNDSKLGGTQDIYQNDEDLLNSNTTKFQDKREYETLNYQRSQLNISNALSHSMVPLMSRHQIPQKSFDFQNKLSDKAKNDSKSSFSKLKSQQMTQYMRNKMKSKKEHETNSQVSNPQYTSVNNKSRTTSIQNKKEIKTLPRYNYDITNLDIAQTNLENNDSILSEQSKLVSTRPVNHLEESKTEKTIESDVRTLQTKISESNNDNFKVKDNQNQDIAHTTQNLPSLFKTEKNNSQNNENHLNETQVTTILQKTGSFQTLNTNLVQDDKQNNQKQELQQTTDSILPMIQTLPIAHGDSSQLSLSENIQSYYDYSTRYRVPRLNGQQFHMPYSQISYSNKHRSELQMDNFANNYKVIITPSTSSLNYQSKNKQLRMEQKQSKIFQRELMIKLKKSRQSSQKQTRNISPETKGDLQLQSYGHYQEQSQQNKQKRNGPPRSVLKILDMQTLGKSAPLQIGHRSVSMKKRYLRNYQQDFFNMQDDMPKDDDKVQQFPPTQLKQEQKPPLSRVTELMSPLERLTGTDVTRNDLLILMNGGKANNKNSLSFDGSEQKSKLDSKFNTEYQNQNIVNQYKEESSQNNSKRIPNKNDNHINMNKDSGINKLKPNDNQQDETTPRMTMIQTKSQGTLGASQQSFVTVGNLKAQGQQLESQTQRKQSKLDLHRSSIALKQGLLQLSNSSRLPRNHDETKVQMSISNKDDGGVPAESSREHQPIQHSDIKIGLNQQQHQQQMSKSVESTTRNLVRQAFNFHENAYRNQFNLQTLKMQGMKYEGLNKIQSVQTLVKTGNDQSNFTNQSMKISQNLDAHLQMHLKTRMRQKLKILEITQSVTEGITPKSRQSQQPLSRAGKSYSSQNQTSNQVSKQILRSNNSTMQIQQRNINSKDERKLDGVVGTQLILEQNNGQGDYQGRKKHARGASISAWAEINKNQPASTTTSDIVNIQIQKNGKDLLNVIKHS